MPTKRPRHMITETPPVERALDALRERGDGDRIDLGELVVLGAKEKLARLKAEDERRTGLLHDLAEAIRGGTLPPVDLEAAAEARRGRVFE